MIAIIDYGMGNLASVNGALHQLGYDCIISDNSKEILAAKKVILPGVGAFADAMNNIKQKGLDQVIKQVIAAEVPILGICLGLQLLFSFSEENGYYEGLNIVNGGVKRFRAQGIKVPHVGWNNIVIKPSQVLFKGIPDHTYFYFVHSYCGIPQDKSWVAAVCNYGEDFCCAIEKSKVYATQFHPEKSGYWGLKVLRNFGES